MMLRIACSNITSCLGFGDLPLYCRKGYYQCTGLSNVAIIYAVYKKIYVTKHNVTDTGMLFIRNMLFAIFNVKVFKN